MQSISFSSVKLPLILLLIMSLHVWVFLCDLANLWTAISDNTKMKSADGTTHFSLYIFLGYVE